MTEQWVIKSGTAVVHGPAEWAPLDFGDRLGALGHSVCIGAAPAPWQAADGSAALLPCSVVCPSFDARYQVRTGPTFSGGDDALVAAYTVSPRPLADLRVVRIAETKAEAGRLILALYPMWKQSNMLMRMGELHDKRLAGGTLTEAEEAEAVTLRGHADTIKGIRAASDVIEAWINDDARTAADLVTMAGAPGWGG